MGIARGTVHAKLRIRRRVVSHSVRTVVWLYSTLHPGSLK